MNIAYKNSNRILMLILFLLLACQGCQPTPVKQTQAPTLQPATIYTITSTPVQTSTLTSVNPTDTPSLPQHLSSLPRGRATINNAWTGYDTSGFKFDNAHIVSWASGQADILASSRDQASNLIWFFVPNDTPPYQSRYDQDAQSGIIEMPQSSLAAVSECPKDGYRVHWVEAKIGSVYCMRTRDGSHYASLQVVNNKDNLVFEWMYLSAMNATETVAASPQPFMPITYTSMDRKNLILFPIIGRNLVLLVPSSNFDQDVLNKIVDALDQVYDFYNYSTGRQPLLSYNYQGKATVAVVPSTCDEVCSTQGMSGIELQSEYFDKFYRGVKEYDQYDLSVIEALGRNFWFYDSEIEYKEDDFTASISEGYGVFMRTLAIEAAGIAPASSQDRDYYREKADVEGLLPVYWQYASLNWNNTLGIGEAPPNSAGLGGGHFFASILFDLRKRFGNPFTQWIWKEVDLRPDADTTQEAVDNFVLAACAATEKNLTDLFVQRYRWSVSSAAVKEAITRFGDAVQP